MIFSMMMNPEKNRLFRIEYIYRPGLYWTDQEMACYHAELEAIAKDCFRQVPQYQCLSGTRKELERNVITLARDHKGLPVGFCSAVILDVDGYKNVLHLGLACVKKEARSLGLTHLLTSKLLFNYLIRTSPFKSIWVTNVACVISSLGNVALYFEKVHPSPFTQSGPSLDHIRTEFYLNRLDFEKGYEVLQISKAGLLSYPKYLIRLALPALVKFLPVFYLSPQRYRKTNARMVSCVSNHLSYIDVLILSTLFPGCFVTSVETREISSALQNGLNVIIFPEGTSTNGDTVLRFRQPLFQAALDAGKDILPVGISYETINHCPVTPQNRDLVFWYGDMTFFNHFAGLSHIRDIQVRVTISPVLPVSCCKNPADLSAAAHQAVKKACLGQSPGCFSEGGIKNG